MESDQWGTGRNLSSNEYRPGVSSIGGRGLSSTSFSVMPVRVEPASWAMVGLTGTHL